MMRLATGFWLDQSGQDLSEYALLLALISAALILVIVALRDQIISAFSRVANVLQNGNANAAS